MKLDYSEIQNEVEYLQSTEHTTDLSKPEGKIYFTFTQCRHKLCCAFCCPSKTLFWTTAVLPREHDYWRFIYGSKIIVLT